MEQKKIALLLGIHNHQPVGNFDHIFEKAYQDAYEPFIKLIDDFPEIKFSLHYSGCLWDWLEDHHPEFFPLISKLVKRGQVSLISGGIYEPLLPLLPRQDSREQILALNDYLKDKFGFKARGFWLTERVWEPTIPELVSPTGLEYTMVDDTHFATAGLKNEDIHGLFITEDQGYTLKIFPIDKKLRYLIPFRLPEETINYLREARARGVEALTLADDGEKFGLWPGTRKWVYEEKWLFKFLTLLRENDFIETLTFEEYLDRHPEFTRVYLPTASYQEMMEWSGGFFRNFLAKYPEAHNLYSKMLYVSQKVEQASSGKRPGEMKTCLWKGQCSCPYWHGVFGGLYLPHLREANYNNLIQAEVMAASALKETSRLLKIEQTPGFSSGCVEWVDFDQDGEEEILAETRDLNLYLKPSLGGGIFELDYKPKAINLQNILSRRPEAYHQKIMARSSGGGSEHESIHELEKKADFDPAKVLVYDQYQRHSFLLRFMNTFKEELIKNGQRGEGEEILLGPYTVKSENKKEGLIISLAKTASLGPSLVNVLKKISLKKTGGEIEYELELSLEGESLKGILGLEFCLSILEADYSYEKDRFSIKDKHRDLEVSFIARPEALWWKGQLKTVSQSEISYELTPQGLIIFPYWELDLKPGQKINFYLKEKIS